MHSHIEEIAGRTQFKVVTRAALSTTQAEFLGRDPNRLRAIFAVVFSDLAVGVDNPTPRIWWKDAEGLRHIAGLSLARPSIVLTVEEYGEAVYGPLHVDDPEGLTNECTASEVVRIN